MNEISAGELAALMAGGPPHAVLDLRERAAFERRHIYWSTSLPRRLLELRLPGLVTAPATPIVLVDDDGRLAALALPTLAALGYLDARTLALDGWIAAGRPLVQGLNVPSKAFGERLLHERATPSLGPHELLALRERSADVVVLDSRTPEEYVRGTIPGAISVPGAELALRICDLAPSPETTIVVSCGGRTRSIVGTESLRALGLPNPLFSLENGTMGWELAGLELERGASRSAPPLSSAARDGAEAAVARIAAERGVPTIAPLELQGLWESRREENVQILDVRSAEEFAAGHLAGAANVPGGQAVQATDDAIAVRAATIVLSCDSLVRSTMTALWLRELGLANVVVLAGGLPAWIDAGGLVETGPVPRPAPPPVDAISASELQGRQPAVIDVGESSTYARGHVPGAAWLCRSRLELQIGKHVAHREAPLVVTCADGWSSALAAAQLAGAGFSEVRVLDGGTESWERAGYPLETGLTTLWDEVDDVVLKPYDKGREAIEAYLAWEIDLDMDALAARGGDLMATLEEAKQGTYTFDEFIVDVDRLTAAETDPETITGRVAELLERLIQDPECIDEQFRRNPRGGRGRYMLHRASRFNVTSVLWRPGDRIEAHTHETWGVIGILQNEIQETRFLTDMGPVGTKAALPVKAVNRQVAGTVSRLVPGDDIHEMHNVTDRDTIEIHVYGKDLVGLDRRRLGPDGIVQPLVSPKYLNC